MVAQAQTDRKYIRDGNRNYHKREFAKAETMYRKAVADNPDNPQAIYNLGCALMMQNKDSAAVEQFQNAAKLEKNKQRQFKSFHNIGVICQNHKMYDDAIKAYQQALRNNPNDNETRYNLVLCKKLRKNNSDKKQYKYNGHRYVPQKSAEQRAADAREKAHLDSLLAIDYTLPDYSSLFPPHREAVR